MTERRFEPGAAATIQLKDMDNILAGARAHGRELPDSALVRSLYPSLVARGLGHVDHSGTYLELERLNGIDLPFADGEPIT
jgi:2-hydroxy-3-oxopropionate reductase